MLDSNPPLLLSWDSIKITVSNSKVIDPEKISFQSHFHSLMSMIRILLESILPILVLFPIITYLAKEHTQVKTLIIFTLIFLVYQILIKLPTVIQDVQIIHSKWNWTGKMYSITFGLLVYYSIREYLKPFDFIRLRQEAISFNKTLLVASIPVFLALFSFFGPPRVYDFETLLYESTMPGIDEEIIFRAILLGIMLTTLKERISFFNLSIVNHSLILNGLLFGLAHGLHVTEDFGIKFDYGQGIGTFFYGYLFSWITIQSKSIFIGTISHNLGNLLLYLIPMIK